MRAQISKYPTDEESGSEEKISLHRISEHSQQHEHFFVDFEKEIAVNSIDFDKSHKGPYQC